MLQCKVQLDYKCGNARSTGNRDISLAVSKEILNGYQCFIFKELLYIFNILLFTVL